GGGGEVLDEGVHGREAEGGGGLLLGREERLENPAADRLGNPRARVLDLEDNGAVFPVRLNAEAPLPAHRVARVDEEIHQDLLEPGAVGQDLGKAWLEREADFDRGAERPGEDPQRLEDDVVDGDRDALEGTSARE